MDYTLELVNVNNLLREKTIFFILYPTVLILVFFYLMDSQ